MKLKIKDIFNLPQAIIFFSFLLLAGALFPINSAWAWGNLTGGDHGGADWTISSNTNVAGDHTNIGAFQVNSGITATVGDYSSYGSFTVSAETVTIEGTINAGGKGYRGAIGTGEGSGGGRGTGGGSKHCGGGAGYGGAGGAGYDGGSGGPAYGSSSACVTPQMGSGGGGYSYKPYGWANPITVVGGDGGGKIVLTAASDIDISGIVSSNGYSGTYSPTAYYAASGGGSGGGIMIDSECGDVTISGTVRANGGAGGSDGSYKGGGGAGGRIKILYGSSLDTTGATITATGGTGYQSGANGTISYNGYPIKPTLVMPEDEDCTADDTPTFTWDIPSDADSDTIDFKVEIATDSGFTSHVTGSPFQSTASYTGFEYQDASGWHNMSAAITSGTGYDARYTLQSALDPGTYYWRISARDSCDYGCEADYYTLGVGICNVYVPIQSFSGGGFLAF